MLDHSLAIILLGALLIPYPSIQHFIWPLSWCLLADMCNHTWIPECGQDNTSWRMFIDECDMFEYNCDYERDYELVNYSDCFRMASDCPTQAPCPSHPTCKDHRFHRMNDILGARRMLVTRHTHPSLPERMLRGKRRYTPVPKIRRSHTRKRKSKPKRKTRRNMRRTIRRTLRRTLRRTVRTTRQIAKMTKATTTQMIILKRETILRNGIKLIKVVKGYAWKLNKPLKIVEEIKENSDFLE